MFFVLTDPHGEPPAVLIANVTSIRKHVPYDKTCVLDGTEHPFLVHRSYIAYEFAEVMPLAAISRGMKTGEMKIMGAIKEDVCARVCEGVLKSPAIPLKCRKFYETAAKGH